MNTLQSTLRGGLVGGVLVLLVALVTRAVISVYPPEREAWSLISVSRDMSVVYARMSTASTGLLDHQVTSRLAALPIHSYAVEHRAVLGPIDGGQSLQNGIASGADSLRWRVDRWALRMGGDDVQVRAELKPGPIQSCPPSLGSVSGVLGVGDSGSASGAMLLDGTAAVIHTIARGNVENRAIYVLGPGFSAGVDPLADCRAWVVAGADQWTGEAVALADDPDAPAGSLQLGAWTLRVRRLDDALRMESFGQVLPFERWMARLAGVREPVMRLQRATVRVEGPGISGPRAGLVIDRGL